jgi:2'-5' RNA ligase
MRLFIAIVVDEWRAYLKQLQDQLPESKRRLNKHPHLTLKFLGDVRTDKVELIQKALRTIRFSPFEICLGKIGVFSDEEHIRVVWAGVDDGKHLKALQQHIDEALKTLFPRETLFEGHLTIARIKHIEDTKTFAAALHKIKTEPLTHQVTSFALVKSTLTKGGPKHEIVEEYHAII